jgi:hypothetical protein
MDRKDFLKLPIEERRTLLKEMANDPEIIAYYNNLERKTNKREMLTFGEFIREPKDTNPQIKRPPILTDEQIQDICAKLTKAAETSEIEVAGINEATWVLVNMLLKAQRDDTFRETLKMVADVLKKKEWFGEKLTYTDRLKVLEYIRSGDIINKLEGGEGDYFPTPEEQEEHDENYDFMRHK